MSDSYKKSDTEKNPQNNAKNEAKGLRATTNPIANWNSYNYLRSNKETISSFGCNNIICAD